jgi:hypothetical protein
MIPPPVIPTMALLQALLLKTCQRIGSAQPVVLEKINSKKPD